MKNKLFIIPALALLGVTALAGYTTYAEEIERRMPNLTEEQRTILEDIRESRMSGEEGSLTEEQKELLQELRKHKRDHKAKIHSIIEADDYEAFAEAVEGTPMAGIIDSEEKFNILVQAHSLREEGNHEEARELMSELGLKRPHKMYRNLIAS